MHTNLKAKSGLPVASNYCPLDLFSNDASRMKKAIHALFDAWVETDARINNLKVFVDGKKIRPQEVCTHAYYLIFHEFIIDLSAISCSEKEEMAPTTSFVPH